MNLSLPQDVHVPLQMHYEHESTIASTIRILLNQAHQTGTDSEKQEVVAFLFLSLPRNGLGDVFIDLDADLRHSLLVESTNHQGFHLVQFQRAGTALDEANLVLSRSEEHDP